MTIFHESTFDLPDGQFPSDWQTVFQTGTNTCETLNNKLRFSFTGDSSLNVNVIKTVNFDDPAPEDWTLTCEYGIISSSLHSDTNYIIYMYIVGGPSLRIESTATGLVMKAVAGGTYTISLPSTSGKFRIDRIGTYFFVGYEVGGVHQWDGGPPLSYEDTDYNLLSGIYFESRLDNSTASHIVDVDNVKLFNDTAPPISDFWTNFSLHTERDDGIGFLSKQATETLVPAVGGQAYIPPTEYVPPQIVVEHKTEKTCKRVG